MARPKKPGPSISEQITEISAQIEKTEGKLKDLKQRKKELEKLQKDEEVSQIYDALQNSSKTTADVLRFLVEGGD